MGTSDVVIDQANGENPSTKPKEKRKGKQDKPKPWDDDPNIDRWKIEKFDPSWNEGGMLEEIRTIPDTRPPPPVSYP